MIIFEKPMAASLFLDVVADETFILATEANIKIVAFFNFASVSVLTFSTLFAAKFASAWVALCCGSYHHVVLILASEKHLALQLSVVC